jgi:spore coat protein CotH
MSRSKCNACGGRFTGDHPQVGITSEYGLHAHVDSEMADLIAACWDLNLATTSSCQGGKDETAYVGFGPGSAERFATFATEARTGGELELQAQDALDWRIYQMRDMGDPSGWRWIPGYPWASGFTVYFPPGDIAEVTRRLEAEAEANR